MVISKSVPVLCGTAEWLPYLYGARRGRPHLCGAAPIPAWICMARAEWLPYLYGGLYQLGCTNNLHAMICEHHVSQHNIFAALARNSYSCQCNHACIIGTEVHTV